MFIRPDGPLLEEAIRICSLHDPHAGPYSIAKTTTFYRLALNAPRQGAIVELGTSRGLGTVALCYGARDGHDQPVYTVDSYRYHINWAGGEEHPEAKKEFLILCGEAGVRPILVEMDVTRAGQTWRNGAIGLIMWDLGLAGRMRSDFLVWEALVVPGGRFAFRDVDNGCLGHEETIATALATGWTNPQEWPRFIWTVDREER